MMSVSYDARLSPWFTALLLDNRGAPAGNRRGLLRTTFDDRQHIIFFHDEVLLAVEFDLLAGVLAEEDSVACFDVEGDPLALAIGFAVARREDGALLRLLLRGVRDVDSTDLLFTLLEAVNDDAVVEWPDIHDCCAPAAGPVARTRTATRAPSSRAMPVERIAVATGRSGTGGVSSLSIWRRLARASRNRA